MIIRQQATCPGCENTITVRIAAFPTDFLRYYVICPVCKTPIRGSVEGHEPKTYKLSIEGGFRLEEGDFPTVTVDPLFPINTSSTSLAQRGGGPNMLFFELVRDPEKAMAIASFGQLVSEHNQMIPTIRRALEYYEHESYDQFWAYVERNLLWAYTADRDPGAVHAVAHQLWTGWLLPYVFGMRDPDIVGATLQQHADWHSAALKSGEYRLLLTKAVEEGKSKDMTTRLIGATRSMMGMSAAWRAGYFRNRLGEDAELSDLRLLQDEFDGLRDCYQKVFESCCAALWPLVLAHNTAVNGDPKNFSGVRFKKKGEESWNEVRGLRAFNNLPNAHKLATIAELPGMGTSFSMLDSGTRNAIGHATAYHELARGTIVNDKNEEKGYFDFVGETYSLVGALASCVTISRAVAVTGSELLA